MPIRCVILDFDGTFTDVDQEAAPFVDAFPLLVGDLVGTAQVGRLWHHAVADVRAHPQRHGWMYDGKVVAPGDADPYVIATSAVNLVLDWLGMLRDPALRSAVVMALHRHAYQATQPAFRPHAAEVLRDLLARELSVFVVSNADTATVRRKLDTLGIPILSPEAPAQRGQMQLYGDARKFAVEELAQPDPRFAALPVSVDLGSGRPIFVRRANYFRVLREIWGKVGAGPESTLVCGDIFELDLALPQALGCQVQLVSRPSTPEHERRFVGLDHVSEDLRAIAPRLS